MTPHVSQWHLAVSLWAMPKTTNPSEFRILVSELGSAPYHATTSAVACVTAL